jgi:hypothetical protein
VVDALLAGHLQVVAAAKADVVVLLQVLDIKDNATLVTPGPQALAAVHWLSALAVGVRGAAQAHRDGAIDGQVFKGAVAFWTCLGDQAGAEVRARGEGELSGNLRVHRGKGFRQGLLLWKGKVGGLWKECWVLVHGVPGMGITENNVGMEVNQATIASCGHSECVIKSGSTKLIVVEVLGMHLTETERAMGRVAPRCQL